MTTHDSRLTPLTRVTTLMTFTTHSHSQIIIGRPWGKSLGSPLGTLDVRLLRLLRGITAAAAGLLPVHGRPRRLADHEPDLGAHRDGAELLVERAAAAERHAVDRDQLVTHGNAAAALGLAILGDRQHLVLAVDGEPEPDRSAHKLHRLRRSGSAREGAGRRLRRLGLFSLGLGVG